MFKNVRVENFKAVPYLESSLLMQSHPDGVVFSEDKPNVLVGPNGSGKSSLLTALAIHSLSYFTGRSNFDRNYLGILSKEEFWTKVSRWGDEYRFLDGMVCVSDLAPAAYYRPGHIPGNYSDIGHAMMTYFNEAKDLGSRLRNKSSGQKMLVQLEEVMDMVSTGTPIFDYTYVNWSHGVEEREIAKTTFPQATDFKAETLKSEYAVRNRGLKSSVLLDEPEQSLDALAVAKLWNSIENVDCRKLQVIVATHSLYPVLHPDRFNIIESVSGYVEQVRASINLSDSI